MPEFSSGWAASPLLQAGGVVEGIGPPHEKKSSLRTAPSLFQASSAKDGKSPQHGMGKIQDPSPGNAESVAEQCHGSRTESKVLFGGMLNRGKIGVLGKMILNSHIHDFILFQPLELSQVLKLPEDSRMILQLSGLSGLKQ